MEAPGFWDDRAGAAPLLQKRRSLEKRLATLARRIAKARARLETARAEVVQWHGRLH